MKLAVFSGQYFCFDGRHYSTDEAFVKFVTSFQPYFEKIIFCDAVKTDGTTQAYILDPAKTEVCPLPYFNLYSMWRNILTILPRVWRVVRHNIRYWDVVWLHTPHPVSLILAYFCRRRSKPFFLFIRQNLRVYIGHRNQGGKRILAILVAHLLEYVFRLVSRKTLTFAVGHDLTQICRKTGNWVQQIEVSLVSEADIVHCVRERIPENPAYLKLLYVGRLDAEKGLRYLVKALRVLVVKGDGNFTLQLVGEGPEAQRLRNQVANLGLSRHVIFGGYVPHGRELYDIYKKNDILVLPSLTEGCPQVLFEAMACGIPVVATKVGGVPHLIEDEKNGLLVDPASSKELVAAIRRFCADPQLGTRLAEAGLSTVRNYTIEAKTNQMIRCIKRLLEITTRTPIEASN
jgi:glycosyltransferase involved in cell wall biosynthesis